MRFSRQPTLSERQIMLLPEAAPNRMTDCMVDTKARFPPPLTMLRYLPPAFPSSAV